MSTQWPEPEYGNHGNGGFAEWWEISGVARVYNERDAWLIHSAPEMLALLKQLVNCRCVDEFVGEIQAVISAAERSKS